MALSHASGAEPVAAVPVSSTASAQHDETTPWIFIGVGAAAALAGAIMIGVGAVDFDATTHPHSDENVYARALARQNGADVLIGVGSALAGVGLVLAIVGATWNVASSSSADVAVRVTPTSVAVDAFF